MKRILTLASLFGAAVLLLGTPGPNHKIDWCHFPPGLVDNTPPKVLILSIDVAADGSVGPAHQNHVMDGPVCVGPIIGPTPDGCAPYPGVVKFGSNPVTYLAPLGSTCESVNCPSITDHELSPPSLVQLVPGTGALANSCVCPPSSGLAGLLPANDDLSGIGNTTCVRLH